MPEELARGRHLDPRAQDRVRSGQEHGVEDLQHVSVEQAHAPPEREEEEQGAEAQEDDDGPAEGPG